MAPARCLGCLREQTWLCEDCRESLPLYSVQRNVRGLAGLASAGQYSSPVFRRGVGWLKFKGVTGLAPVLARLMEPALAAIAPPPQLRRQAVLIPMPLHRRRLRQRGFNQSEEITGALSCHANIPQWNGLIRVKPTWTQTKLPPQLRRQNTKNVFALQGPLPDKRYWLLVDDVTTTGSTLADAARPLKQAGAREVWGVTAARG